MDVHTVLTSWKVVFIFIFFVSLGVRQSSCCAPITHIEIGKLRVMQSTELLHWLACRLHGKILLRIFLSKWLFLAAERTREHFGIVSEGVNYHDVIKYT